MHSDIEQEAPRPLGIVEKIDVARGFGFIRNATAERGEPLIFFHYSELLDVWKPAEVREQLIGRAVSFELGEDKYMAGRGPRGSLSSSPPKRWRRRSRR